MGDLTTQPAAPPVSRSVAVRRLTGVQALGTGSYVPESVLRNEDLEKIGFDADWIVQRTGIRERRRANDSEATSDLAYQAAMRCLDAAGVSPEQVDLILVGTMTPDTPCPSTACQLQSRLGSIAPAVDLNAACSGFMYAMIIGSQFVATGGSQYCLVVGADTMSRVIRPDDEKTYPLFGDGAGAVLLGPGSGEQGLLAYVLGADGDGGGLLCVPGGGSRAPLTPESIAKGDHCLHMDGRSVFKWAVRLVSDSIGRVFEHAGLSADDVDHFLFHQANARIIDAAVEDLGIDPKRVVTNLDRFGNTSAASIPLVLDEAHRAGRIERGDKLLLCGFGAGLTWGTAILKW